MEQEWTGILGFSKDYNPLIGSLPYRPAEYIIAGFSGHGMAMAFGAGKALAELIVGQITEPWVDIFDPSRFF